MHPDSDNLLALLGCCFSDTALLNRALTHRSHGSGNNERMEFLGDALLGYLIADALYERFPLLPEGDMTRLRASLVNRDSLAGLAGSLNLGQYLRLGPGERKSGGQRRKSILSNAFEALVCAVYLDQGLETCRRVVLTLFDEKLRNLPSRGLDKDAKTRLQEFLQSRNRLLPNYVVIDCREHAERPVFLIECQVEGLDEPARGSGSSRKRAEQQAAEQALRALGVD